MNYLLWFCWFVGAHAAILQKTTDLHDRYEKTVYGFNGTIRLSHAVHLIKHYRIQKGKKTKQFFYSGSSFTVQKQY